jgi:hypothetical protein
MKPLLSGVIEQPKPKAAIEERYRSRLMLTDRTDIAGTPVPQKLPFRVLVLGDFSGGGESKLAEKVRPPLDQRQIRSFDRTKGDVRVDDVMFAMNPWVDLPDPHKLQCKGTITLNGGLEVDLGRTPKDGEEYPVRGTATFKSTRQQTGTAELEERNLLVSGKLTLKLEGKRPKWAECTGCDSHSDHTARRTSLRAARWSNSIASSHRWLRAVARRLMTFPADVSFHRAPERFMLTLKTHLQLASTGPLPTGCAARRAAA